MKKKRLNRKGFTLIEILAAVTILGILSSIAVVSVSKYKENAKQDDYDALAKASYDAYEIYCMNHNKRNGTSVELNTLLDEQLIENLIDPGNKENECTGYVKSEGSLEDEDEFEVYLCCGNYKYHYTFGSTEKTEEISSCS